MKKWKKIKKSRLAAVLAGILVFGAGAAVLFNASSFNAVFEPEDYERFENENGEGYDSVAGDGEESDLADEQEDGQEHAQRDAQKALKVDEDESMDTDHPGLANQQNQAGDSRQEENPDAFELVDNKGTGGIDVRPGDGSGGNAAGSGKDPNGNEGNPAVPGGSGNFGQTNRPGGSGNPGISDRPDRPGRPDIPGKPVYPDIPDQPENPDIPVNWEEEQLKPRDPVQTEHGTLVRLSAVIHREYYPGDVFAGEDATVTAIFQQGGTSREITVPYGGEDGYSVQISTKNRGTHTATFTYRGVTARAQYEVIASGVSVCYLGRRDGRDYAVEFPGPIDVECSASLHPQSGGTVDLTDIHSRLIAYLGDSEIEQEFRNTADGNYKYVVFLKEKEGYLTTMISGFRYYSGGSLADDGGPYLYYPVSNWGALMRHIVGEVVEVPEGYKIVRSVTKEGDLNEYRGGQVLKQYTGSGTVLDVPMGVTEICLEGTQGNGKVTSMVLPESVSRIDFAGIARCLPELEAYGYKGPGAGSYQVIDGALYSRDGSTLISVPAGKTELKIPDTVTTIAENAFQNSRIRELTIPGTVTLLEEDCLKGFAGEVIRIEGGGDLKVSGDTGYAGKILFPDSAYDVLLKKGTAVFHSEKIAFGAMDENGKEIPDKTGLYRYDGNRRILTLRDEPDTLAGILPDRYGYYQVPEGITAIGEGAFAGADRLREIGIPDTVRELRAGSLALIDNVRRVLLSAEMTEVSPELFGDPAGGAKVPKIEICVPKEAYHAYLEKWSQALDPVYGRQTARGLLTVNDNTVFYENEAKYQRGSSGGREFYRLLEVYAQDQTAFRVKDQTTEIGDGAFAGCAMLEILYLPDTVSKVGDGAFAGCKNLQTITAKSSGLFPDHVFDSSDSSVKIYERGSRFVEFVYDEGIIYGKSADGSYTLIDVPTDRTEDVVVCRKTGYLNEEAFRDCVSINHIEIPDQGSLTEIGARCFENCRSIGEFDLTGAVRLEKVGEEAFRSCTGLRSLSLPECISEVGKGMCYDCISLEKVDARGLTRIGDEVFYNCAGLSGNGMLLGWDQITAIGDRAFACCTLISALPDMSSLQSLGIQAFFSCQRLTGVVLPETLTSMGEECFGECGALTQVTMNGKLTGISRYCFYGCRKLSKVEFGEQQQKALQLIGVQAFGQCSSLESLDLGAFPELKQMGERTFLGCEALITAKLPENLKKIPDYCFEDCRNLSILTLISDNVPEVGNAVFGDALSPYIHIWVKEGKLADYETAYTEKLDQLYGEGTAKKILGIIDDTKEVITGIVFEITDKGKILKEVTDAFRTAFEGTYSVPAETVRIETEAFLGCPNLTGVVLPDNSRISLGDRCFKACPSLQKADLCGSIPEWGEETFMDCTALQEVNIGRTGREEIPRIGTRAFKGCVGMSDRENALSISAPVSILGVECFADCANLQAVPVTDIARKSMEVIEDRAFAGCVSLTQFLTSAFTEIKTIGNYAFYNCDSLRNPSVPARVTSIGEGCFAECAGLSTVSFYCVLEEYPKDCFKNCPNLTRTGGVSGALKGLRRIGGGAYEGCTSLTTNTAWNLGKYSGLEEIGANAFRGCANMTDIELPATLRQIGQGAFDGLSSAVNMIFYSNEPPKIGSMNLGSMPAGFGIRVPDSQAENDNVYKAYLAVFAEMFGADKAYEILDSVSDGAKARNSADITPDGLDETGGADCTVLPWGQDDTVLSGSQDELKMQPEFQEESKEILEDDHTTVRTGDAGD